MSNVDSSGARHASPLLSSSNVQLALDDTLVLRGVSLSLYPGEFVGLIGPNGAGKTTLLKALGGLISRSAGEIVLADSPLDTYKPREVARLVAHVPQSTVVDFAFTVREVVEMGRSPHLGRFELGTSEDRAIVDAALKRLDVSGLTDRYIGTLSGGERQRTFIARALAQEPHILLLDEPTANLDVRHQLDVLDIVRDLAREEGLGVIAALHDLALAAEYADRLILLHEGRVLADASPAEVLTPEHVNNAFEIDAQVYRDPYSGALRLSMSRNGSRGCGESGDAAG